MPTKTSPEESKNKETKKPEAKTKSPLSKLLANSAILGLTMMAVSAGNYLLNMILARVLNPEDFGDANLAVNLVLLSAVIAATFQLIASKSVAANPDYSNFILQKLKKYSLLIGTATAGIFIIGSPILKELLQTKSLYIFIFIGLGLPFYFVQAVYRGVLQGKLSISRLAISYGIEVTIRLMVTVGLLVSGMGSLAAAIAIFASFMASYTYTKMKVDNPKKLQDTLPTNNLVISTELKSTAISAGILLTGQVLINNGDVLLSKAYFSPQEAGYYAATALLGRAIFFISWSVVNVVFPMVADKSTTTEVRRKSMYGGIILTASICLSGIIGYKILGSSISNLLLGNTYSQSSELLVPYAIATSLFVMANLFATVDLALGNIKTPILFLGGAILQTILLIFFARTRTAMVSMQILAMFITLIATALSYLKHQNINNKNRTSSN